MKQTERQTDTGGGGGGGVRGEKWADRQWGHGRDRVGRETGGGGGGGRQRQRRQWDGERDREGEGGGGGEGRRETDDKDPKDPNCWLFLAGVCVWWVYFPYSF